MTNLSLMVVIVDFGIGSKVLKLAKKKGVTGGTIFLGKGTVDDKLLDVLGICDTRKEIVLMVAEDRISNATMPFIEEKLKLKEKQNGIGFSSSINYFTGSKNKSNPDNKVEVESMFNCIYVVVDKGRAVDVVDSANKAGSKGGTIINARGSGIHETSKLFSMEIEPEKEVVLILAESEITDNIVKAITEDLEIEKPGNGILFVQSVTNTYGMKRSN